MLWVKSFHIIFMVTWFAGLFYLPRLFVYHVMADDSLSLERFLLMERRLYVIMSIGMAGTVFFGLWLIVGWWWPMPGWLHAKLGLAVGLVAYHLHLNRIRLQLVREPKRYSHKALRWINEVPVLFLVTMTLLVELQPF